MLLVADFLLIGAAFGAGFYCWVLGRRLRQFNNLENGMGGAVAVLSAQVDDLTKTLASAQNSAMSSSKSLEDLTYRAEDVRRQLELQIASVQDIVPKRSAPDLTPTEPAAPKEGEPMFVRHRAGG